MSHSEDSATDNSQPNSQDRSSENAASAGSTPTPDNAAASAGETPAEAAAQPIRINLPAAYVIDHASSAEAGPAWTQESDPPPRSWLRQRAPLAAGVAIAVALGAIAGAATTTAFVRKAPAPAATASTSHALQQSLARLETELASVKAGIAAAQRNAGAQFGKLAERIDRAEKAQTEPGAKLSKIIESLDRVEHRMPQAGVLPPPASRPDITGSVAAKSEAMSAPTSAPKIEPKQEAKSETRPPLAEGWHLLDVYAGRAVVENRSGRLFEVGPGSNLPELGRVEGIRREGGRVVVVTRNGIIAAAAIERRRLPRFMSYYD